MSVSGVRGVWMHMNKANPQEHLHSVSMSMSVSISVSVSVSVSMTVSVAVSVSVALIVAMSADDMRGVLTHSCVA